eukprot:3940236-Rhodomonas_salina.2
MSGTDVAHRAAVCYALSGTALAARCARLVPPGPDDQRRVGHPSGMLPPDTPKSSTRKLRLSTICTRNAFSRI